MKNGVESIFTQKFLLNFRIIKKHQVVTSYICHFEVDKLKWYFPVKFTPIIKHNFLLCDLVLLFLWDLLETSKTLSCQVCTQL